MDRHRALLLFRGLLDSGPLDSLFAGLTVCTPEGLGYLGTNVWNFRRSLFLKDVAIKHGTQKKRNGDIRIDVSANLSTVDAASQDALNAKPRWLHDAMTPSPAKLHMHG